MKKFEYKSLPLKHTELVVSTKLNELGKDGWELIQVVHQYGTGHGLESPSVLCILKREK